MLARPAIDVPTIRGVWSVSALVGAIAAIVEQGLPACTVAGEVSGYARAASGHCYFTLKDMAGGATLRCAMFRRAAQMLDFEPSDGMRVEVRGRVCVYEPRGELQLVAEAMRPAGAGALYERFLRLRARLESEGLFDDAVKRPLPSHPLAVGIVTSLDAAALHDVATTLARRSPHVRVVVYPSLVQGADAPAALCAAIGLANARAEVDVLVVCRGGGSLEQLWAFNDERVVRAIRASALRTVSGVGHETDVTLADLAADLRAPTPTAAAELVGPMTVAHAAGLASLAEAMRRRVGAVLGNEAQRLDRLSLWLARPGASISRHRHALERLADRLGRTPLSTVESGRRSADAAAERMARTIVSALARSRSPVDALAARLERSLGSTCGRSRARLDAAAVRLASLDPERVLARGYALLADRSGRPIVSVRQLARGGEVIARLADGRASLTTTTVAPELDRS